jgi:hypothetical protein
MKTTTLRDCKTVAELIFELQMCDQDAAVRITAYGREMPMKISVCAETTKKWGSRVYLGALPTARPKGSK